MQRRDTFRAAFVLLAASAMAFLVRSAGLLASVQGGLDAIRGDIELPTGAGGGGIRASVIHVLLFVLTFLALAAVITIIAAGILLIVGAGSETSVQRSKKIILYTVIGLVVVFFARVIVGFLIALPT